MGLESSVPEFLLCGTTGHSVMMASFPFMLTFFSATSSDKARASEGRATPRMKATSCWLSMRLLISGNSADAISGFAGRIHSIFCLRKDSGRKSFR